MMTTHWDRRTFLRRLGAASFGAPMLGAPVLTLTTCSDRSQTEPEASTSTPHLTVVDPIIHSYGADAACIVAPLPGPPIAYVSQGLQLVFINREFRDLLVGILSAHISVSTGHWRIPQPGEPLKEPLIPGVPQHEFEEVGIGDLDLEMEPSEGDFRIRRGQRAETTIDFSCIAMADSSQHVSGGPWRVEQCDGSGRGTCREDFVEVGIGSRYAAASCGTGALDIRLLSWVCPES
jgi:hypothetical protein